MTLLPAAAMDEENDGPATLRPRSRWREGVDVQTIFTLRGIVIEYALE
jgi:hypothetical protein